LAFESEAAGALGVASALDAPGDALLVVLAAPDGSFAGSPPHAKIDNDATTILKWDLFTRRSLRMAGTPRQRISATAATRHMR